ncbi:glycogen synthase GlgA [Collinsella tanakaei]|nr:glycogen synthase GlgA [Collinsella tanakaei]
MANQKLHIVFASAEAAPFVKTGGLGDVAGSLPAALAAAGAEVIVMVPKYATIADEYKNQMEHVTQFYVPLGWRNEYCGLERLVYDGVTYMFLDNEHYFSRSYPYGFFDDGERFAFFSKAVCESLQYLPDFQTDVLHCNDWHTALAPVFLREFYMASPLYRNVKTVFSIHNIAFQGQFTDMLLGDILGLSHIEPAVRQLRCDARSINYMQGALNYSDAITTVSPTYSWEIRTPEFGEGLDGILRRRENVLSGILNGLDVNRNDPATDNRIHANYTREDRSGKAACKAALQEELGLEVRDDRPLMVMVTRLTRQKGMDLVTYSLDRILSGGVQVAVLGTGDAEYEDALRYFERTYPGTMAARIEFDPFLSQRMYSGADMFLMPSLFEPCGLSQMIAMRYGTLPIVRETGGLKDTVIPYNMFTGEGTGFTFTHFNGDEMGDAVFRAARTFWDDKDAWNHLIDNAMSADFSWKRSAEQYMDLYYGLHPEIERYVPFVAEPEPQESAPATEPVEDKAEAPAAPEPATETAPAAPVAETETAAEAPAAAPAAEPEPKAAEPAEPAEDAAPKAAEEVKPAAKKLAAKKTTTARKTATKTTTAKTAAAKTTVSKTAASKTTKAAAAKTADEAPAAETKTTTAKKTAAAKTTASKTTATKTTAAKKTASAKTAVSTKTNEAPATEAKTTTTAKKTTAAKTTKTASTAAKTTATKAAAKTTAAKTAKADDAKADQPASAEPAAEKPAPKAKTVSAARKTSRAKR